MGSIDLEEQLFDDEVKAIKRWWSDTRWRYTKRPFTAEQIVSKRGNLKIDYPSNVQSKKLWNIVEAKFKVGLPLYLVSHVLQADFDLRMATLAIPMVSWSQPCSRKWQNISTRFMSRVGNALLLLRQPMNLRQISQTIQWYDVN